MLAISITHAFLVLLAVEQVASAPVAIQAGVLNARGRSGFNEGAFAFILVSFHSLS